MRLVITDDRPRSYLLPPPAEPLEPGGFLIESEQLTARSWRLAVQPAAAGRWTLRTLHLVSLPPASAFATQRPQSVPVPAITLRVRGVGSPSSFGRPVRSVPLRWPPLVWAVVGLLAAAVVVVVARFFHSWWSSRHSLERETAELLEAARRGSLSHATVVQRAAGLIRRHLARRGIAGAQSLPPVTLAAAVATADLAVANRAEEIAAVLSCADAATYGSQPPSLADAREAAALLERLNNRPGGEGQ